MFEYVINPLITELIEVDQNYNVGRLRFWTLFVETDEK